MPHRPPPGRPVPTSTYRLQLHGGFTFADAADHADRIAAMGVSHLYLSPILQATPGSMHGYDVVDHSRVSEDLGGVDGLRALADRAHGLGLGLVADLVPNHMTTPTPAYLNRQWWSLLREGRDSPFAHWFDIDWPAHDWRVLVPVLGGRAEDLLEAGELTVAADGGPGRDEAVVRYHEHEFPVRPGTEDLPLASLLDAQAYRLADWRRAARELNYRRFFDVTTLIAVRVEEPDVFEATHRVLLDLVGSGVLDGLRVDHPDGLADPAGYLARLREETNGSWVVAEKILEGDEQLPEDWECAGTTGYDTLLRVGGVFVDPEGADALTREWQEVSGSDASVAEVATQAKQQVVTDVLGAEVHRLLRCLAALCPDLDRDALERGLTAVLVSMDRYRAYVRPGHPAPAESREVLAATAARARARLGESDRPGQEAVEAVVGLALGDAPAGTRAAEHPMVHADVMVRFQQTCGPVMAKGIEDTAFYRHHRLIALNEVGGDPTHLGVSTAELRDFANRIRATRPTTMTTLSTHDTKRSEDVRARLAVLAERTDDWRAWVARARDLTAASRPGLLDGATEYLLWQTAVGTWPIGGDRLHSYLEKAVREAKVHTTWTEVDPEYEDAVRTLADAVLDDPAVRDHVQAWVDATAAASRAVSLGQKLLQLVAPGVPDVYQGSEVLDLSLVDPDNRRAVDHLEIARRLDHLDAGREPTDLDDEKLLVTTTALRLRREHPEWFTGEGALVEEVTTSTATALAMARGEGTASVVAVVTRFASRLESGGGWGESTVSLPPGQWRDLLGGHVGAGEVPLRELLSELPVALLVRSDG